MHLEHFNDDYARISFIIWPLINSGIPWKWDLTGSRYPIVKKSSNRGRRWEKRPLITSPAERTVYLSCSEKKGPVFSPRPSHNVAVQRLWFALSLLMRAGRAFFDLRSLINARCHENLSPFFLPASHLKAIKTAARLMHCFLFRCDCFENGHHKCVLNIINKTFMY